MLNKDKYTYNLLVKENKRLLRENEKLKKYISDLEQNRENYLRAIDRMIVLQGNYKKSLKNIKELEEEYEKKLEKL